MDDNELPRMLFEAGIATREQADKLAELLAQQRQKEWGSPDDLMTG